MTTMTYTSHWDTHPRDEGGRFLPARLDASVHGVPLQKGVAYQFDLYDGGKVVTCRWTGTVDTDGCPLMETVDFPTYTYCPRSATWFAPLSEVTA